MPEARCHCGAIRIYVSRDPRTGICAGRRYFHCKRCGCVTHYEFRASMARLDLGVRTVTNRPIVDTAILIGWSPDGHCVYSAAIPLGEYRAGAHAWDTPDGARKLRLEKLRGFLFNADGALIEEFENNFDAGSGRMKGGWTRHEDGTFQRHDAS